MMEGGGGGENEIPADSSRGAVLKRRREDSRELESKHIKNDSALKGESEGNIADPSINVSVTGVTGGDVKTSNVVGINYGVVNKYVTETDPAKDILARTKDEVECMTAGMIRVSAVDVVVNMLSSGQHWVTITGNAGDGKTTLGYLVLKEFLQKGVGVYTIYKPEEYDQIAKMKEDKLIMFDDRFGAFLADHQLIKSWHDVIQKISRRKPKTEVIFISRKNVVKESIVYLGHLADVVFKRECVVDLSKRKLTDERRKILDHHLGLENVTIDPEMKAIVCNMEVAHGFPHCCKMFSNLRSKGYNVPIEEFFRSPLKFLDMTTKVLYNDNCKTLFQLMIKNDGQLDIYDIKDEAERHDLLKVEKEQEGSYITVWRDGTCQFAHPSVYESVLNVINDIDPLFCVQYATLSVIRQKIIVSTSDEEDKRRSPCYIIVKPIPAVLKALAERFREEILKGHYSVFKHRLCDSRKFCEALVSCCITTNETEKDSKQFINLPGADGATMLCTAARNRRMAAVHTLVKAKGDVDIQDRRGRTPLHYLCQIMNSADDDDDYVFMDEDDYDNDDDIDYKSNDIDIETIRVIITDGRADVNLSDQNGRTPLHCLCQVNSTGDQQKVLIDCIRVIITEGRADVNRSDQYGRTPLHYLCQIKNSADDDDDYVFMDDDYYEHDDDIYYKSNDIDIETIRMFITEGRADVNLSDQYGRTPLHCLCQVNSTGDQQKVLVDSIRVIITEGRADVNISDQYGRTPLHSLCQVNSTGDQHKVLVDSIRVIITEGRADVNISDQYGRTPLHCLCQVNSTGDQQKVLIDCIRVIITEGRADVNISDHYERTPLHYVCQLISPGVQRRVDINTVLMIITEGRGEVNYQDKYGQTPLYYLFKCGVFSREEMQLIITKIKGDLNLCEQNMSTPLHYLCANSSLQLDTVDLVIKEGKGDFNKGDEHGTTPFHHLCENGMGEFRTVLQIANTANGDINKQDDNGITPLHFLCKGSLPMKDVLTFLHQGYRADRYGNTPLHYLCRRWGMDTEVLQQQLEQIPQSEMEKQNILGYTPMDYLSDQDGRLPWADGMIARSPADLVVTHTDDRIVVLGMEMGGAFNFENDQ